MCGIVAIFASMMKETELRQAALEAGKKIQHRGPDWNGIRVFPDKGIAIEHERLAIIDPESGAQPLVSNDADKSITLAVNGEIYNYRQLAAELKTPYNFLTKSDCEVIIPLYLEHGADFVHKLRGMFSFVLYDAKKDFFMAARDHMGITPLYYGYGADGSVWFASEMKALEHGCVRFEVFPPGNTFTSETETCSPWYNPAWYSPDHIGTTPLDLKVLREAFEASVKRRMMSDVPWGVLLSGGLDSSLVASIAVREKKKLVAAGGEWINRIHSFTIGLENSPDLIAAKEVADFLGTIHHSYTYTIQEGLDAVSEVIKHLETYDVTTVRASTPMFLMSRKIKAMGIKMVLSGEGADEVFGGYLYFHKAPNAKAFHRETVDKLRSLYQYDCLRANKSTSAWGLEARVPFLDADFLDLAMNIDSKEKMIDLKNGKMEKYIIRKAFDDEEEPYLPKRILWRQKEQFSDGVGYGWIDSLKDLAEREVTERQMKHAERLFPYNPPQTKEAYLYRSIFQKHFEKEVAAQTVPGGPSIACSTAAAIEWDAAFKNSADPSGRAIAGVHVDAYGDNNSDADAMQYQVNESEADVRWEATRDNNHETTKSSSSLPPITTTIPNDRSSMLPRLAPPSKSTAPSDPQLQKQELSGSLSRLPMPRQQQNPQAPSSSMLRFPSLIKPQHRIPPLPEPSKCNQEDEEQKEHPNGDLSARKALKGGGGNNGDEEDEDAIRTSNSRSTSGPAPGGLTATRPIGDKNRDFIRELEEKKRKQKEDQARQERRKQKLQEKLSRRILEEAAQARQKQQPELSEPEENGQGEQTGDDQPHEDQSDLRKGQSDESATRPESKELRERKEKIKRQKRLLKKQQTLLEQIQTKKKEKQEGLELEKEKERRKQEKVKKAILDAIYDANSRMQEEEEEEAQQSSEDDEETTQQGLKTEVGGHRSSAGATLAATAAGSVMALLRDRKEALAAVATTPAVPQEEVNEEQKQRVKEQRDAINRKQQEYLQKLADQRRQKQKEEEEARLLQEKRKKKIQQEALLRHQEVSKQQQEVAAAAQKEKDESAEKMATAAPPVDVEAMVARLSRLKERDAQVIPEARDYASWKKRHGVRPDQNVFCMTGAYPVIREELEKRGWYYNHEKVSPFFDLKWSLKSDDLKAFKLEKHQYVNHFFQNTAITTKVGLLHNLRNMVWHQSVDIDTIFPRAYDLNEPRDMETFIQDFRYGFAEGLLKELARIYVQRKKKKTISIKANIGVLDVLLSVARKKLKSKRSDVQDFPAPEDNDPLEESIDSQFSTSSEELVTNMQWEALTKCQVDKPGSLRASLMYKKKIFVEDRADASFGIEANGSSGASQVNGSSVDTVLSALEKKQQRQIEKQRVEAFNREKARLNQLLAQVSSIDETTMNDVVGLVKALERLCPQFRINGGCDFLLSGDQQANGAEAESMSSKSRNIWIVKPAGMSRGRGIRVFNNLDLLLEYADVENHKECQWVAQKYIENPLLMCKRKFDIRQWVLVTGWDPLTVWFYQDCYLRFSSEEYSIDDLSDQYVHLTNNSIQKYSDKFNDAYATDDGDIRVVGNMLHSDDFKQYIRTKLHKEDIWDTSIQPRMKDIVIASLQCVQDMVQHRTNCCELFGYDFMIDTDLKPWLIEVNSSPACDYSTPTAERYVKTGLADIIKVIVDHREFEQKKKSGGGAALAEPDTGCWQRIHKAEYIGKPVSSFGADFFVKGAKVQKAKRNRNSSSTGSGAKANNYNSATSGPSASSVSVTHDVVESGGAGGFMVVEEEDEEAVGHQGDDSRAIDQEPSSLAAAEEEESDASEDGENEEETGPPHAAHDEQRPWDPDESCRADEGDDCEDDGAASDLGGDLDVDPLL